MPDISTSKYGAGAVGSTVGTAFKVLSNTEQGGRLVRGVLAGGYSFAQTCLRVARILFLQVTGFFFLCFALVVSTAAVREWKKYAAGDIGPAKAYLAIALAVMFSYFGISSFWRAAKKTK